jgi:hypothetical protein
MSPKRFAWVLGALIWMVGPSGAVADEEISPAKRALIGELLEITDSKNMAENLLQSILAQFDQNYYQMVAGLIAQEKRLDADQRKDLERLIVASQKRFMAKFRKAYADRIRIGEIIEKISYPLYAKHFTENELRDLIAFYKTPTGRKTLAVMPELMTDSMRRTSEIVNPILLQLVGELVEEEKKAILLDLDAR